MIKSPYNKILIIDEHEEFRNSLKDYLAKSIESADVREASSGENGIKKALKEHPDITLEIDKLLTDMSAAEEKLAVMELHYGRNGTGKAIL